MTLIIQIPCYNEEDNLRQVVNDLPKSIPGIDKIEIQIIDDGSTDSTAEVIRSINPAHVITFKQNRGLAAAFRAGAANAIRVGADILVNTDADNQYVGEDVRKLVEPLVNRRADVVVGCRPIVDHPEFTFVKKLLQLLGSKVLRTLSQTTVRDAASGFRAYSRDALLHLNVYTRFSYCMETLIQAGLTNLKVESVDIRVNPKTRDSRLFKSIFSYIYKSGATMVNVFFLYRAKDVFFLLGLGSLAGAVALAGRYLVLVLMYDYPRGTFWPSVVLAGILLALSVQLVIAGILASLVASNRQLLEELVYNSRKGSDD